MSESFSFNREFDFVRLDGLRRSTGRPPHEWDLYILKELIDNALDADDVLWSAGNTESPRIEIRIEYINVSERRARQLFVQVSNRAKFPVHQIKEIFSTQRYTSRKAFIKGLTRGALGNAMKTVLGIPYALRNRVAGDWNPELKPLAIRCRASEYLLRFLVDSTAQTIRFECETKESQFAEGTIVSVGLDHFDQELPRTLADIQWLAAQYHLCNPHAELRWLVEIEGKEWIVEYSADKAWDGKFREIAPVQWYSATAFQDLIGALYRKRFGARQHCKLPTEAIVRYLAGSDSLESNNAELSSTNNFKDLGIAELDAADIEGQVSNRLYRALCRRSPSFDSARLGAIGTGHICGVLTSYLPVEGEVFYSISTDDGNDPSVPFVLEVAVARLRDGNRQIWTAINFTPTYGDPFLSHWLSAPIRPDEPVLGLRGIADAYGFRDDDPIVIFLHLICPSIEHHEFSKTEINHLPFKHVLGETLHRLLTALRQAHEDEELRLEQTVFEILDAILSELGENERFVFEQLLEKLRLRLTQEPTLAAWLKTPDAAARMRSYVASYQSRNSLLTHRVARPAAGTLSIPLHPDRHFSVLPEHVSRDLLSQHYVNKLLYVQARELEPVFIDNGWLCRMDMALLHNPPGGDGLREAFTQCMASNNLVILILHDGDEAGRAVVEQLNVWTSEQHLDVRRIIGLGLGPVGDAKGASVPRKLVEMMPRELAEWLVDRFEAMDIPIKSRPPDADIRRNMSECFDALLKGYIWEGISQQFQVTRLLADLDRRLSFTKSMIDRSLDEQLKRRLEERSCAETYVTVLNKVVGDFFEDFMREHGTSIRELVRAHLAQGSTR